MKHFIPSTIGLLWVALGCIAPGANAQMFTLTQGFENEPTPSTGPEQFIGGPDALSDQANENVVSPGLVGEIGFSVFSESSHNDDGLGSGDDIGVHTAAQINMNPAISSPGNWTGSFADGSTNAYIIGDPDGLTTLTFNPIDLSAATNVVVSLDFLALSTGWETPDMLDVQLVTNLGTTFLLDINDGDTLDLGTAPITAGVFAPLSLNIPDAATIATLSISLNSNSNTEAIIFDNIMFSGTGSATVVPEPSTVLGTLLAAAGFGWAAFKRFKQKAR